MAYTLAAANSATASLSGSNEKPVPNPLNKYASSTYGFSLWWLDLADAQTLMGISDVGTGNTFTLSKTSYCIAEDSGLYPDRRSPYQFGLDYFITDVEFMTVTGLNSTSKSSNLAKGHMTIVEPYGMSLLDVIVNTSFDGSRHNNYIEQPWLLQLDFFGTDDNGNRIPLDSKTFRKRFPVKILSIKINFTNKGAEYKLEFVPWSQVGYLNAHAYTPQTSMTVKASTVGEFFADFKKQLNGFWQKEISTKKRQFADLFDYDIHPDIASSSIIDSGQMSFAQANPEGAKEVSFSKGVFSIPAGTRIVDLLDKIMCQSKYIINQLSLNIDQLSRVDQLTTYQQNVYNHFKTTLRTIPGGQTASGGSAGGQIDNILNVRPLTFTYCIGKYAVYNNVNPWGPVLSYPGDNVVKEYNYTYTGKNTDIIKLDVNFDTSYYTNVAAYIDQNASANLSKDEQQDTSANNPNALIASMLKTPQYYAALTPGIAQAPNVTPLQYRIYVNNQKVSQGVNINTNPSAFAASDLFNTLYNKQHSGDMLVLNMTIIGDPTLVKQDDILYVASPSEAPNYNNVNTNQAQYVAQYGHVKMDKGQLVARVNINTPIDIDTDYKNGNQGLVFPKMQGVNSTSSLFSGYYHIKIIKNIFQKGMFTQELTLTRYPTDVMAKDVQDAVTASRAGQNAANNPLPASNNNSTPANNSNNSNSGNSARQ